MRAKATNFFTVLRPGPITPIVPTFTVKPEYPYSAGSLRGPKLAELLGKLAHGPIINARSGHVQVIIT